MWPLYCEQGDSLHCDHCGYLYCDQGDRLFSVQGVNTRFGCSASFAGKLILRTLSSVFDSTCLYK